MAPFIEQIATKITLGKISFRPDGSHSHATQIEAQIMREERIQDMIREVESNGLHDSKSLAEVIKVLHRATKNRLS